MASEDGRTDLRGRLLDRWGAKGEALYMFVLGFVAISVNGFAAYLLGRPLLFPSLAPTVFQVFRSPLSKEASPRNTVTGHFAAVALGLASLALFGLLDDPSVLREGVTLARIGAAALSLALTEAVLISFNRPHPPAATTTLLVSLGLFKSPNELVSLVAGIVLLTAIMWVFNRLLGVRVPVWAPRR